MKVRLLKKVFRNGRLAVGMSGAVIVGRFAVNQFAKRLEKEVRQQELSGQVDPAVAKRLKIVQIARGVLNVL